MTTVESRDPRLADAIVGLPPRKRAAGTAAPEAPPPTGAVTTAPVATMLEQLIRREAATRSLGC